MSAGVPDDLLARLSAIGAERSGRHFPKSRWRELQQWRGPAARMLAAITTISIRFSLWKGKRRWRKR